MPGSTQKYPTQHASVAIAIIKDPPLLSEIIFPIKIKYFVTKNLYRNEIEIILIFKYIWYHCEMLNVITLFYLYYTSMTWINVTGTAV